MLKTAATVLVGCLFVVGAVYYFLWFQSDINEIKNEVGSTLIQAKFLVMKKYDLKQAKELTKVSADYGFFTNPNQLTLKGSVVLIESNEESSSKKSTTDELFVEFDQNTFQAVIKNAKVKKAEAKGRVSFNFNDHLVKTESCFYTAKENMIQSNTKVVADGLNRQIIGENGFLYDLDNETMKMNGKVRGYFGG